MGFQPSLWAVLPLAHRRFLSYRGTYSSHRYRQYLLMQFSQRPRPLGLVRLWPYLALQQTICLRGPIAASNFHSVGDNALTLARHPVLSDYVVGDHPAECIRSLVQERGGGQASASDAAASRCFLQPFFAAAVKMGNEVKRLTRRKHNSAGRRCNAVMAGDSA